MLNFNSFCVIFLLKVKKLFLLKAVYISHVRTAS